MTLRTSPARALQPMVARDPHERHRPATTLELLFDLVFVIAIAAAAEGLHHAIAEAHAVEGILRFALAFFAIWWAWMNYTWFASSYDNDDVAFRLLTMAIMGGALIVAAAIPQLFATFSIAMVIAGYVVMRLAMIALWLRAARGDPARRAATLTYAAGIAAVQVFWIGLLLVDPSSEILLYALFALGGLLELSVPVLAERRGETPWHRHHIIERYGLLTIIVLGESLLAATTALGAAMGGHFDIALVQIALSALAIVFAMWWLYFTREDHLDSQDLGRALGWGYGHVVIFASGAAVGAGFAVLVDAVTGHAAVGLFAGDLAVAVPLALFLLGLWFVRDRHCLAGPGAWVLAVFAGLVVITPLLGLGLESIAVVMALCVFARSVAAGR